MCVQMTSDETLKDVPIDFENFLKSLGSAVYKYKAARVRSGAETGAGADAGAGAAGDRQRHHEYSNASITLPTKISMRNEGIFQQKAALRDVLMMKLVSYYENKYKITDSISATDISLQRENCNEADALNEMKRTENTRNNLKSKDNEIAVVEEVLIA